MDAADLADDAFVMLDPAVEIVQVASAFSLLCQTALEVGMVAPPGEGILDFVRSLQAAPVQVGSLREDYDDRALVDGLLASLLAHGFAHVTSHDAPSAEALTRLRADRSAARGLRRRVAVDLDVPGALEQRVAAWSAGTTAAEVELRCARLADHAAPLAELARRRQAGALRAHHIIVRTADARCDPSTREALLRLNAAVEIEDVPWPAPPAPIPGLAELARHLVPCHAIMRPDASILDELVRGRAVAWVRSASVSGLCLRLDPEVLWRGAATDEAMTAVFDAVQALDAEVGDVVVMDMPSDDVLLGCSEHAPVPAEASDRVRRLRLAYVRWRTPIVKALEDDLVWPQLAELEHKWIRPTEDLLPNHPELLQLAPGSTIADVAGGLGRVARRLRPAIGPDGTIVSIELRRPLTERARRFAYEQGALNLQFRPGLAQRLPLPDGSVDAAVSEWTGTIWRLGIGPAMVSEMARVVRPGGRIAVTHRLVQLRLGELDQPWVQYKDIYQWVRDAFQLPELTIVVERVWGQTLPSVAGESARDWTERFMPRLVTNHGEKLEDDGDPRSPLVDVYLTMIAERQRS
jgi:ubiquinone/menaquinone biosynthesis C-methylase UbiE